MAWQALRARDPDGAAIPMPVEPCVPALTRTLNTPRYSFAIGHP
jgi:hypothetical protein